MIGSKSLIQRQSTASRGRESRAIANAKLFRWGWLPALSVTGASGLLVIAFADAAARSNDAAATWVFWLGILLLVVPMAARLLSTGAERHERVGIVVMVGFGLYVAKILQSPVHFTFVDEFQHWRTADDILQSGRLFQPNPILTVGPYFPGLELITTAVINLSGLDIFDAGLITLGVARLVFALSLFLFYEEASGSPRVAGVASLVYMCNPGFLFFDGVFAYESLALPLAMLTLFVIASRTNTGRHNRLGLNLAVVLGVIAVTITHHVTSYALAAFLVLWTMITWLRASRRALVRRARAYNIFSLRNRRIDLEPAKQWALPRGLAILPVTASTESTEVAGTAALCVVAGIVWLVYSASVAINYLAVQLLNSLNSMVQLIAGEAVSREFFQAGGHSAPVWEQMAAYASVGLTLLALPFGLVWIWQRYRARKVSLALAVGSLAYVLSLPFHLTSRGTLVSNRSVPFLFVAVAFVVAIAVVELRLPRVRKGDLLVLLTAGAATILMGGIVLGWPEPWRLPGPFLVSSHTRSADPQGITAAEWARTYLGPNNRMAADWINTLLMGSFGHQDVETGLVDGVNVAPLFLSASIGKEEQLILQRGRIHYVVIDHRLSTALPLTGWYFVNGEPNTQHYTSPIDLALLEKFDHQINLSRLFDSGDIVIYDVGRLTDAP
jgi:hypothetical protein